MFSQEKGSNVELNCKVLLLSQARIADFAEGYSFNHRVDKELTIKSNQNRWIIVEKIEEAELVKDDAKFLFGECANCYKFITKTTLFAWGGYRTF
jgi:hypothetical protein